MYICAQIHTHTLIYGNKNDLMTDTMYTLTVSVFRKYIMTDTMYILTASLTLSFAPYMYSHTYLCILYTCIETKMTCWHSWCIYILPHSLVNALWQTRCIYLLPHSLFLLHFMRFDPNMTVYVFIHVLDCICIHTRTCAYYVHV
jgi:hypothetical protein